MTMTFSISHSKVTRAKVTRAAAVLSGSLFIASFGSAFAQDGSKARQDYMALVQAPVAVSVGRACDPANKFHCAGTRGRLGQGADALYPEGPGNVSN